MKTTPTETDIESTHCVLDDRADDPDAYATESPTAFELAPLELTSQQGWY